MQCPLTGSINIIMSYVTRTVGLLEIGQTAYRPFSWRVLHPPVSDSNQHKKSSHQRQCNTTRMTSTLQTSASVSLCPVRSVLCCTRRDRKIWMALQKVSAQQQRTDVWLWWCWCRFDRPGLRFIGRYAIIGSAYKYVGSINMQRPLDSRNPLHGHHKTPTIGAALKLH